MLNDGIRPLDECKTGQKIKRAQTQRSTKDGVKMGMWKSFLGVRNKVLKEVKTVHLSCHTVGCCVRLCVRAKEQRTSLSLKDPRRCVTSYHTVGLKSDQSHENTHTLTYLCNLLTPLCQAAIDNKDSVFKVFIWTDCRELQDWHLTRLMS